MGSGRGDRTQEAGSSRGEAKRSYKDKLKGRKELHSLMEGQMMEQADRELDSASA